MVRLCRGRTAGAIAPSLLWMALAAASNARAEQPGVFPPKNGTIDLRGAGAIGDGRADDTDAIQNILDRYFPPYTRSGVYNFYVRQTHPVLVIPPGQYRITRTLDLSFRNDLTILCSGELVWDGPCDGTVIEAVGCSRLRVYGLRIHGGGRAGTFIHVSGNGTADGKPELRNARRGKGNSSANRFVDCWFGRQYPESEKAMVDTIPYPTDTPHTWYYSMDDSAFTRCFFQSAGRFGFALALGSSEIGLSQCNISTPNGLDLHTSATVKLFKCVFSLQANDRGAFFLRPGAHIGEISLYGCYLEGTTAPLVNAADSAHPGSVKAVNVYGGLFAQKPGAKCFVRIPRGWVGALLFSNPRFQEPVGRIFAPDCSVHMERLAIGDRWRDYPVEIEAAAATGFQSEVQRRFVLRPERCVRRLAVRLGRAGNVPGSSSADALLRNSAGPGSSPVRVLLHDDAVVTQDHVIEGSIVLAAESAKERPVLRLEGAVRVGTGGRLVVQGVDVQFGAAARLVNDGGRIRVENAALLGPAPEVCLCRHDGGHTVFRDVELRNGGAVDVTDPYADGALIMDGVRCSDAEIAVRTGGRRIPGLRILVVSKSVPAHGFWDVGAVLVNPRPGPDEVIEQICIRGGTPGIWKPLVRTEP